MGLGAGVIANAVFFYFVRRDQADEAAAQKRSSTSEASGVRLRRGIKLHEKYSHLDLTKLLKGSKRRFKAFTVSGRNFLLAPPMLALIMEKIRDRSSQCRIEVLSLDQFGDRDFVASRREMMNTPGRYNPYDADFHRSRESARQITDTDPQHAKFDMRFYNLLPTTFFIFADDTLYITFLLSKPVAECPVFEVDCNLFPNIARLFEDHFDFYWKESRFFVTVIGFRPDRNTFVMVKNHKRKWEWPSGYIEPAENPVESAKREFREETGLEITNVVEVRKTPSGIYFAGLIGNEVGDASAREIADRRDFVVLPERSELSFPDDVALFNEILKDAKARVAK
jgi:8-oxo-dGTP pyrophosphatase MutT (NUDIX family)